VLACLDAWGFDSAHATMSTRQLAASDRICHGLPAFLQVGSAGVAANIS
jgi:hypothetical protein